jgi:hypothetical protein
MRDGEVAPVSTDEATASTNGASVTSAPNPVLAAVAELRARREVLIQRIAEIDAQLAEAARAIGEGRHGIARSTTAGASRYRRKYVEHKQRGLCVKCDEPAVPKRNGALGILCGTHAAANNELAKAYYANRGKAEGREVSHG